MATTPEIKGQIPSEISIPEVPEQVEQVGEMANVTPQQPPTTINDQKAKPVADDQTVQPVHQSSTKTIKIPADDQASLAALSKGSDTDSITWFANFWLRVIKRAWTAGWQIIFGR